MAKFQVLLGGSWQDFSDMHHVQLASAWEAGLPSAQLAHGGDDYEVSFARLEQRNLATGRCRRVRPPLGLLGKASATASTCSTRSSVSSSSVSATFSSACAREGCGKPSWTGVEGDFCSEQCLALSRSPELVATAFECPCCMDDVPPMAGLRTCPMPKPLGCGHSMCKECFKRLVSGQIEKKEPSVCPMCPETRPSVIPSWLVARVLGSKSAAAMVEIEQMHLGQADGGKLRLWQCPTPDCKNQMVLPKWWDHNKITDKRRLLNCGACRKKICIRCQTEEHNGVTCEAYQEWKKANAAADQSYAQLLISGLIKPCPNCKAPILKNDGCNFMTCSSCKSPNGMCWETGKPRHGPGSCGGGHNCH